MIEALKNRLAILDSTYIENLTKFAYSKKLPINEFLKEALNMLIDELNGSKEFGDNPFLILIKEHKIGLLQDKINNKAEDSSL